MDVFVKWRYRYVNDDWHGLGLRTRAKVPAWLPGRRTWLQVCTSTGD